MVDMIWGSWSADVIEQGKRGTRQNCHCNGVITEVELIDER